MKTGHSLREIDRFPRDLLDRLRDELSVTTAEEFVDLGHRLPEQLRSALQVGDELFRDLYAAAFGALSPQQRREIMAPKRESYPFATGHDAPVEGETFHDEERERDRSEAEADPLFPDLQRRT